jgi:hypothetical protein
MSSSHVRRSIVALAAGFALAAAPAAAEAAGPAPARTNSFLRNASHTAISAVGAALETTARKQ